MKTKLLTFLVCLMMLFSLNSCVLSGYATTQDDIYTETKVDVVRSNVSFDIIIQYAPPQDPTFFIHRVGRTARASR